MDTILVSEHHFTHNFKDLYEIRINGSEICTSEVKEPFNIKTLTFDIDKNKVVKEVYKLSVTTHKMSSGEEVNEITKVEKLDNV